MGLLRIKDTTAPLPPSPTCANCGFNEDEHRGGQCPGGCTCGEACDDRFAPEQGDR